MEETLRLDELEWRKHAACLPYPAELFFGADDNESPIDRDGREDAAKSICVTCDVRTDCLQYAIRTKEQFGIWGGLTELERKALQSVRAG